MMTLEELKAKANEPGNEWLMAEVSKLLEECLQEALDEEIVRQIRANLFP